MLPSWTATLAGGSFVAEGTHDCPPQPRSTMNILDSIVGARDGGAVQQIASQFGLRPEQATAAIGALMPALAAGLKRNMTTNEAGLESALASGHHETYIDQPQVLGAPETTADGNAILGHIFGSKDVSRKVAAGAAERTGIDPAVLKRMLPLLAALAMGAMAKQKKSVPVGGAGAAQSGGLAGMLEPLLDRDRDGSIVDDLGGLLGGFLNRKR
jgi:hypothetical protein